jgi:hypothetical protein
MSTARVSYVYKSDVPKSIQSQIQQLHEQETRIVELEVELSQLQKAHAELERDLAPYRIVSSPLLQTLHRPRESHWNYVRSKPHQSIDARMKYFAYSSRPFSSVHTTKILKFHSTTPKSVAYFSFAVDGTRS